MTLLRRLFWLGAGEDAKPPYPLIKVQRLVRGPFPGSLLCCKGLARLWGRILALLDRCEAVGTLAMGVFSGLWAKGLDKAGSSLPVQDVVGSRLAS